MRSLLLCLVLMLPAATGMLGGCAPVTPAASLTGNDRTVVADAETYLNSLPGLQARVLQERDGETASGQLLVLRPGRMQLVYDPPSQMVLRAENGRVTFSDGATGATSTLPLSRTPLALILADRIVFSGPVTVVDVHRMAGGSELTVRSTDHPGQGQLTLQFSGAPMTLRGLVLVDGHGTTTRLLLRDTQIMRATS